jgi:hypothetical protein
MTQAEGLRTAVENFGYGVLAVAYYQAVFTRAAWFIDKKNLSKEFAAADEAGKKH